MLSRSSTLTMLTSLMAQSLACHPVGVTPIPQAARSDGARSAAWSCVPTTTNERKAESHEDKPSPPSDSHLHAPGTSSPRAHGPPRRQGTGRVYALVHFGSDHPIWSYAYSAEAQGRCRKPSPRLRPRPGRLPFWCLNDAEQCRAWAVELQGMMDVAESDAIQALVPMSEAAAAIAADGRPGARPALREASRELRRTCIDAGSNFW